MRFIKTLILRYRLRKYFRRYLSHKWVPMEFGFLAKISRVAFYKCSISWRVDLGIKSATVLDTKQLLN